MPVLPSLIVYRHDRGTATTITLAGEIDLDTAAELRTMVERCLCEGVRSIDFDLTALTFCDVSGLGAFLAAATCAAAVGGSLSLRHPSPMVVRLLDITGTGCLLSRTPKESAPPAGAVAVPVAAGPSRLLAS